jgi:hypothetical protein
MSRCTLAARVLIVGAACALAAAGTAGTAAATPDNSWPWTSMVSPPETSPTGGAGAGCPLYPIALDARVIARAVPGAPLPEAVNGTNPGNFAWLTWTGAAGDTELLAALRPPGTSSEYVNPADPADGTVSLGDRVRARGGVTTSPEFRSALDGLMALNVLVPTWDSVKGSAGNYTFRVAGFALIRLDAYHLTGDKGSTKNRVTATYLGSSCRPPEAVPVAATTAEDVSAAVTLSATGLDSAVVSFAAGSPQHGSVVPVEPAGCEPGLTGFTCSRRAGRRTPECCSSRWRTTDPGPRSRPARRSR